MNLFEKLLDNYLESKKACDLIKVITLVIVFIIIILLIITGIQ